MPSKLKHKRQNHLSFISWTSYAYDYGTSLGWDSTDLKFSGSSGIRIRPIGLSHFFRDERRFQNIWPSTPMWLSLSG